MNTPLTQRRELLLAAAALGGSAHLVFGQAPTGDQVQPRRRHRHAEGQGRRVFKKLAEERTNGKVKVEVYPNRTLYKDNEELEALQLGAVQMLAPSVAKFGPLGASEFEVFDLPYIFDNTASCTR